jgi:uridine kinase
MIKYQELLANLKKWDSATPRAFAIDGVAGSGKTTLASRLQSDIPGSQIVHMDDLYNGWQDPLSKELTMRICDQILKPFLIGSEIIYSKYNWHKNLFDEVIKCAPTKTLILEGVGSGQSAFRNMLSQIIWVEFETEAGFKRVIARDGEVIKTQMLNFLKDQNKHFSAELTKNAADYMISGVP